MFCLAWLMFWKHPFPNTYIIHPVPILTCAWQSETPGKIHANCFPRWLSELKRTLKGWSFLQSPITLLKNRNLKTTGVCLIVVYFSWQFSVNPPCRSISSKHIYSVFLKMLFNNIYLLILLQSTRLQRVR